MPRTAARPLLLGPAGRFSGSAIMALARDALRSAWITARVQRDCATRDAALDALPAAHAAIVAERIAALMIDSTSRMLAELAALDARAARVVADFWSDRRRVAANRALYVAEAIRAGAALPPETARLAA